jgi:glycosyltransferase involved in cell wall biosynthesis
VRRVRIALVTDTYVPQVNGVTTVVHRMVRTLGDAGVPCAVVAPAYPEAATHPGELRIPSVAFPPYPAIRLSLPAARRIGRFLSDFAPDLIHVATEGPLGVVARAQSVRARIPLVTSYHTDFPGYCRHYGAGALEPAVWRWLLWFHRPARLTHTPGEFVCRRLQERGLGQVVVWGRGVDTSHFRPDRDSEIWRRRLGLDAGTALVLHVGRLAPEKSVDVLCQAWTLARAALGRRAQFVVAGDGPSRSLVEARLPWVRRVGFLDRDDLAALYAAADLCVLPSATETCGLVALEAMAAGVPVVAADAGGLRESVHHGVTGLLAPPRDARAFAAHVVELVMERERRRALADGARRFALSRDVSLENAALLEQYRAITAGERAREVECAA